MTGLGRSRVTHRAGLPISYRCSWSIIVSVEHFDAPNRSFGMFEPLIGNKSYDIFIIVDRLQSSVLLSVL
jgi:hypothetical protein